MAVWNWRSRGGEARRKATPVPAQPRCKWVPVARPPARARHRLALPIVLIAALSTCKNEPTELEKLGVTEEEAKQILKKIAASANSPASTDTRTTPEPRPQAPASAPAQRLPEASETPSHQDSGDELVSDHFIVDGLVDVAAAGQSSAHADGVYMVTKEQHLLLARLGPLAVAGEPADTPIAELADDSGPFELSRGPSFGKHHAYWISEHYLYRLPLSDAGKQTPAQRLTSDAREATRVSATSFGAPGMEQDFVAYIALPSEPGGPLIAKLWHEGQAAPLPLTEQGSAALSVQLSAHDETLAAVSLEGRTGMSVLHSRRLHVDGDKLTLGKDQVVWVGGGSTPTTEVRVARGSDSAVFGLLPIEQDTLHFGMTVLELWPARAEQPAPVHFAPYKNGMEYAPTDGTDVCERPTVVFARPSSAVPHAPQELVLAILEAGNVEHELILGRSRAFFDVSIARVRGGALISYVADRRTWARAVRCKTR